MRLKNNNSHFGIVAIGLHWLMAILIIALLCIGLYMTTLAATPQKFALYGYHKEFGILVLALAAFRLIWRIRNQIPSLDLPKWQVMAAYLAHYALYFFMFAMPLSGWFMSSAAGHPPSFFGLFTLPNLVNPNKDLSHWFALAHTWLAYMLIATIGIHTLAALKHHFIDKDNILRRIISSN